MAIRKGKSQLSPTSELRLQAEEHLRAHTSELQPSRTEKAMQPNIRFLSARDTIRGFDALKIPSGGPVSTHIPVVALSANGIPRDIEKGLEAVFFRYLTKPIKVNEFMDTLDAALIFIRNKAAREN